jgi:uncharacterized membrane protein
MPQSDLPDLNGSAVTGSSNDGTVLVGYVGNGTPTALYWTYSNDTYTVNILPGPVGVDVSGGYQANGCNSDGTVITGFGYTQYGESFSVSWTNHVGTVLTFPNYVLSSANIRGSAVASFSYASRSVSTDGSKIVGLYYDHEFALYVYGLYWLNQVEHTLSSTVFPTYATCISGDGNIIGGYMGNGSNSDPVYWTNGTQTVLPGSGLNCQVLNCSLDGSILCGIVPSNNLTTAAYWKNNTLNILDDGYSANCCTATLIGGSLRDNTSVLWNLDGSVNQTLPSLSPGELSTTIYSITPDGTIATGWSSDVDGNQNAVVWRSS